MARPISRRLLIHTATLKRSAGLDRDRNPTFTSTVLKSVRIAATEQIVRGTNGETKADTLTLFIDCTNTTYETPAGDTAAAVTPQELDAIEWNNKTFTVRSVTPCYTKDTDVLHHYEVTLE